MPFYTKYDWVEVWDYNVASDDFTRRWRDEFETLDLSRWIVRNDMSYDGNSSRFWANKTSVKDGKLQFKMTKSNYVDGP